MRRSSLSTPGAGTSTDSYDRTASKVTSTTVERRVVAGIGVLVKDWNVRKLHVVPTDIRIRNLACREAWKSLTELRRHLVHHFERASWAGARICVLSSAVVVGYPGLCCSGSLLSKVSTSCGHVVFNLLRKTREGDQQSRSIATRVKLSCLRRSQNRPWRFGGQIGWHCESPCTVKGNKDVLVTLWEKLRK